MINRKFLVPFCLAISYISGFGQQGGGTFIEDLEKQTYTFLAEKLEGDMPAPMEKAYIEAYLRKAKKEENHAELLHAYKLKLHVVDKPKRICYADSMVAAAKHAGKYDLIGAAYLTRGIVYSDEQSLTKALDNYLIADSYLSNSADDYLRHKTQYNIAQVKYYLGYYSEAAKLFTENLTYFEYVDDLPYLTSLHSLALCYTRLGKFDLGTATNYRGIQEASDRDYPNAILRFINAEGINQYFKKNYKASITKLNESLPVFIDSGDHAGQTVTHFYLGKSHWALNERETALRYFEKVAASFAEKHYSYPDLRESYEFLIDYYKSAGDLERQLYYIEQLLGVDLFLNSTFKVLSGRLHKEYDTKKLITAKKEIERALALKKLMIICLIAVVAVLTFWLCFLIYRSRENKRRFKKVAERRAKPKPTPDMKLAKTTGMKIKPEVIASVLKALDAFEASGRYLEKDMSLSKLATICNSNIVYVSKIVSHSREKGVTDYINDLKIDYIISKLHENSRFRNYTNKALADEAGFSTTQHFTRAFVKLNKVSPTDYIRELKKAKDEHKK